MAILHDWKAAQKWERDWHGDCANSFNEELKQFVYAQRMSLDEFKVQDVASRTFWNFGDNTVIDVGGGAYSLLLKSIAKKRAVIDPCDYPNWVKMRYLECGISFLNEPAELFVDEVRPECLPKADIALIYNCLQHTVDPEKVIKAARLMAKEIRIFEWIETGVNIGHLHTLHAKDLDSWLGGTGKVENINQAGCVGLCYYGVFTV